MTVQASTTQALPPSYVSHFPQGRTHYLFTFFGENFKLYPVIKLIQSHLILRVYL